eukprot:5719188-Heterocapsa_arctica.AAC.1
MFRAGAESGRACGLMASCWGDGCRADAAGNWAAGLIACSGVSRAGPTRVPVFGADRREVASGLWWRSLGLWSAGLTLWSARGALGECASST